MQAEWLSHGTAWMQQKRLLRSYGLNMCGANIREPSFNVVCQEQVAGQDVMEPVPLSELHEAGQ